MYLKLKIILILVFFFWEKKMGVDKSIEQISDNIITEKETELFFSPTEFLSIVILICTTSSLVVHYGRIY